MEVNLTECSERQLYGVETVSSEQGQRKDIPALGTSYHRIVQLSEREALPFYVVSRDFDEQTKEFQLFVGGELERGELKRLVLPASTYGVIKIQPRFKWLWGSAVGQAKRYFYTEWLPRSKYEPRNLEFEYHTEASFGKQASIELYFAIK